GRVDADLLAATLRVGLELHLAIDEGVDGVVAAEPDVASRMEAGAALTDDDGPGLHHFAVVMLDAEALTGAIAAVPGAAHAFLMCHLATPSRSIPRPAGSSPGDGRGCAGSGSCSCTS